MSDEWFSYHDIMFTREQVFWCLQWLDFLQEGHWPPEHRETGYTGKSSNKQSPHAPFENPGQIYAELTDRLARTGIEGKLLVAEVKSGLQIQYLQPESMTALNYISGWRRREMEYKDWKRWQRYENKRELVYMATASIMQGRTVAYS